jgi:colanic acid biosynthesis protein WcaH
MKHIPQKVYKKIIELVPILCVDLIIRNNGKILLVKRKNKPLIGKYWIPGGRVLKNELLIDAVKRKCKNECGLICKEAKEIGTYDYIGKDAPFSGIKSGIHTLSVVFEIKKFTGEVNIDNNHLEYLWGKIEDCPKELKAILNRLNIL